ncbi:MAG: PorP/SprF family type IX secretion system membrane protein [Chitinophagales bacterium]
MKKFWFILIPIIFSGLFSFGQDIHFSQYFASPLTLNPAMTGGFNGDFRVGANYRKQWFVTSAYSTFSAFGDVPLMRKKLNGDQMGAGIYFYNDNAGQGALTTNNVMASYAYHKVLDRFNKHRLSLGVAVGFLQKRVDINKLTFESQFNGDDGFNNVPSGEAFDNTTVFNPDINAGIVWNSRFSDQVNAYVGFSFSHIARPKENFLAGSDNRLSQKYTLHGSIDFKIGQYLHFIPGFMYITQNTAQEITAGTAFGYEVNENSSFYLGGWYRVQDAFVAYLGYEIYNMRIGFSYDATTSTWKEANNGNGAVEVSIVYIHQNEPPHKFSPVRYCPAF